MKTNLLIQDTDFIINGTPTYVGRIWNGNRIEGLLFNSRCIQAIFDDSNPDTRPHWNYPDTGVWDAERNTDEFCAALPVYRRHGLLGVTIGMQGGGSIYTDEIYEAYHASTFREDGSLEPAWLRRLDRVLKAADDCGMVVIVSYFYWMHARRLADEKAVARGVKDLTEYLSNSGYKNLIIEIGNEMELFKRIPHRNLHPDRVHELIQLAQEVCERKILVTASSIGAAENPFGPWLENVDIHTLHGNGLTPAELTEKLERFKAQPEVIDRPIPIIINEDSIYTGNMDAALAAGVSWGYYSQGNGADYKDLTDWTAPRESSYEALSGFQTLPVNWSINTKEKKNFFNHVAEVTGSVQ
ncbi:hypothetical protein [Rubellicoccus peritrichatus]|uniref:Uncharacterized protein n=1 Tax=Rubellicoccus peritrichatus TaxID=3080537 RepID=A0AAQ3L8J8_9BACT|nr:hypothetical protein [Puniceicoccus sp. CR14]WOO39894.1 hypothetical protein RZN69_14810 [Puniceicoccus sp. CR14]